MQTSFFLQFQLVNPNVNIEQRAFEVLKLYFVKPCKDRNVCCCKYHVKLDTLRRGIQKGAHFANLCNCDYIVYTMSTNQDTSSPRCDSLVGT